MKNNYNLLSLVLIFLSYGFYSQTVKEDINETRIGTITMNVSQSVKLPAKDTSSFIYMYFQNAKYQHITDLGSIAIFSKTDLRKFIENLEMCLPFIGSKGKSFHVGNFDVHDFSKNLYVTTKDGEYTYINQKNVIKWLEWLKAQEGYLRRE